MAAADCTRKHRYHGKWGERVEKPCGWCGKAMSLKPSIAKKRECCTRTCALKLRAKREGKLTRGGFYCAGCHEWCERKIHGGNDAGRFCGKDCYVALRARISEERDALWRIRLNNKSSRKSVVDGLKRVCCDCGRAFRQTTHWGRPEVACPDCKEQRRARLRVEYRKTPAGRAICHAAKIRRRARIRGLVSEAIDPIAVFERDKWKCHLCGCKTLKSKRGTCDPRAPELDHVVTLADGGTHTWGNVACACRGCNGAKGARSMGQLGLGLAA